MSPFGYGRGEGVDAGHGDPEWICSKEKPHYDQIFHSLNPIDGKVTGAGTHALSLSPHSHMPPRTHPQDTALRALLDSARSCSRLADLCGALADTHEQNDHFDKVIQVLSVTTQNCNILSQFLYREPADCEPGDISSAVSIHTLNETLVSEDEDRVDSVINKKDSDDDTDEETPDKSRSDETVVSPVPGVFQRILWAIKIFFLIIVNLIMVAVMAELVFLCAAYLATGELHVELRVPRATHAHSLYDMAKAAIFGAQEEVVQIRSVFQLFSRQNFVNILQLLTESLR